MGHRIDAVVAALLHDAAAVVGAPSCRAGCDACCRHSAPVTSGEGVALWQLLTLPPRSGGEPPLGRVLASAADAAPASCPLLVDGLCIGYAARPVSCRTQWVWHAAAHCDATDPAAGRACTPSELLELRYLAYLDDLIAEADAGRVPFAGEVGVVLRVLDAHGEDYRAGADLRRGERLDAPDRWRLRFAPGDGPGDMAERLRARRLAEADRFAREARPMGMPRLRAARSRADLAPLDATGPGL